MKGDVQVIAHLNKILYNELTAINQYWLHYRLLNNWGLLEMAKVWRKESIEEMEHADKFTDRILFLDGFPNMQVLDPLRIGQNVKEIIECDLASEIAAPVVGSTTKSSVSAKPTRIESMPRMSLKKRQIGIEPPEPSSPRLRPIASAPASAISIRSGDVSGSCGTRCPERAPLARRNTFPAATPSRA